LHGNDGDAVLSAKNLIGNLPHMMGVVVADLQEDRT